MLNSQTLSQLSQLLAYLPRQRLRGLAVLLGVSLLVGLFDLVFVGLLARLVGAMSGSRLADKIPSIFVFGGGKADQGLWIAGLLIALVWITMALKYGAALIQSLLSAQIWADYGERIYANVLLQPFEYFQTQNTAHMLARLNRILSRISDDIVLPMLTVVSNLLSVTVLTVGIVVAFGWRALLIFVFLFAAYALSSLLITPPLRFATKQKLVFSLRVNSLLLESTRSIRDVQLYGAERHYLRQFEAIGTRGKKFDRISKLLPDVPRYVIEPAGITVLFLVGLLPALLHRDASRMIQDAVPTLAAIMFAGLRLSAPIQAIFRSINKLRGGLPDISDALQLLQLKPKRLLLGAAATPTPSGVMPRTSIRLENAWYRYPQSKDWVIQGVNLTVPVGSRVALVGQTGGGKSTAAHLLLGLLQPQQGQLLLDGIPVTASELPAWQACCAIVPQNIVLLDASVRANVAFGADDEVIDDDAVWEALEMAQLDEFVSELPYGFYTVVGEDGMRLSGGQRQRLALARAFYKQAKVLILDEATSALDNKTENDVLEALELVGRRCTTVVIAHRLSTIRYCDRIFEFERGRIKASGDYRLLQERSDTFRELVALQEG
ncbi:ABC transporter ATP-binding protein [Vulcanococcus limneticus Candia 3F8]|nr:ABC transporter ATP-binding protein [Vulcanococcus limneticus MW73D5]MCP9894056.1 ABC transporter ATP-binding protein [Vulcanococcus limneticus Candia 3F8]MCP9897762.1 ABC transporter ATP-binding protein [Vulcanococcus limneticus Candia 3B3]